MPDGNSLVATAPEDPDGAGPFTAGNGDYGWAGGIGIAESAMDTFNGIKDGNWVEAGLGMVGLAAEGIAAAVDPFGWLMSSVASFLMEHVQPLKDMLDSVCGDPPVIQSYAETWGNVATHLTTTQENYTTSVQTAMSGWEGGAAEAYQRHADEMTDALKGAASVAGSVSTVTMVFGEVVAFVRELVRDLIADLVGKLISWVLETVFSLGFGTPVVVAQATAAIAKWATKIADLLRRLTDTIRRVSPLLGKLADIIGKVAKVFGKVVGKVTGLSGNDINPGFIQRPGRHNVDGVDTPSGDGPDGGDGPDSSDGNDSGNDNPSNDSPSNDNPSSDSPGNDSPGNDSPSNDSPSNDSPSNDSPSNDSPGNDSPSNDSPGYDSPSNVSPGSDTPSNSTPTATPETSPLNTTTTPHTSTLSNNTPDGSPPGTRPHTSPLSNDTPDGNPPSNSTPDNPPSTNPPTSTTNNGTTNNGTTNNGTPDTSTTNNSTTNNSTTNNGTPDGNPPSTTPYTSSTPDGSSPSGSSPSNPSGGNPDPTPAPSTPTHTPTPSNTTPTPDSGTPSAHNPSSTNPPPHTPEGSTTPGSTTAASPTASPSSATPHLPTQRTDTPAATPQTPVGAPMAGTPGSPGGPGGGPGGSPGGTPGSRPPAGWTGTPGGPAPHSPAPQPAPRGPDQGRPGPANPPTNGQPPNGQNPNSQNPTGSNGSDAPNGHHDPNDPNQPDTPTPDRDPLSPDEVNQRHGEPTPAGSSYHRGDPEMGDLPHRVQPDPDGRYTVDVHVTPEGNARIGGRDYTPEQFADILRRNADYDGQPIRLIGCDAGSNDFARRLSTELDTPVLAPNKPAWTDSNGRVFSSDYEVGPDGRVQPRIPPNGEWSVHTPDGTNTRAGDDGFTPDTHDADKHDLDPGDAQARGAGDDLNPQHQIDGRWQEPDFTPPARPVHLDRTTSLFDDPNLRLEPNSRYDVTGPDGSVRSRVYTDPNGNVTHVDAVAPNRLYVVTNGSGPHNPEIARPAPNADYRVEVGNRADVYPTGPDGEVRMVSHGDGPARVDHIETPPSPADRRPVDGGDPLAPRPDEPFGYRTDADGNLVPRDDLQPNTRYHVTDEAGNDRGTFQTDENGRVRWIDTPTHGDDWRNPDLDNPHPDANYRVDRGPLHQEYHVGPDGRPEPGAPWTDPQPRDRQDHSDLGDREAFHNRQDSAEGLAANTEHRTLDSRGDENGRFYTDESGHVDQAELTSGQRGRTNPEVDAAPEGAQVTQDGYYGTGMQSPVQDSWPTPDREIDYSSEPQTRGFEDERPDGVTDRHEKALSKKLSENSPVVDRRLPPDSRVHIVDADGNPYATIQTDANGKPTHIHTSNEAEIASAERKGVDVTRDENYGADGAESPESDWPSTEREFTYSHEKGPKGFDGDEPSGLTPEQRDAITRDLKGDPLAGRTDLPPNSRITLHDKHGPYSTVQTDADGNVSHVHTYQPFHPALNDPPPNATVRVDHGLEVTNPDGTTRRTEGDVHRTDERGNTVATTSHPEYSGATDRRRDGTAQSNVGGIGGKDADGKNIDDGGHHGGTHSGKPGEQINQSSQGRVDNQGNTSEAAPKYDRSQTWKAMEEARDSERRVEVEDILPARDVDTDDPHTRFYRGTAIDDQGRPHVIVRSFPNDHNTPLWPADFRQRES